MTAFQTWTPYCGAAPIPAEWLGRWNFDPPLLLALGAALAVALRFVALNRRPPALAALLILTLLFVSPFCALTSALFSARVVHHVVLAAIAAPLIAWSIPRTVLRGRRLAVWTASHAFIFWIWHVPGVYAWALSHAQAYWLLQALLFGSGVAFWAQVRLASAPAAAAALLATTVQMGLLGALITFAATPLYAPHLIAPLVWGYTPLEDQQLGGLIMWAPAAALYLGAAVLLFGRWLARAQRLATAAS